MMKFFAFATVLVLFLTASSAFASLAAIRLNNEAKELLGSAVTETVNEETKKTEREVDSAKVYKAYKLLLEALKDAPFNAAIRGNLGLAFELNEEKEKALKEFKAANKYAELTDNDELKFVSRFNLARAYGVEQIDLALESYQKALELNPDSIEVKTNIELLLQQQQGQGKGKGGQGENKNKDKNDQNQDGQGDQEQKDKDQSDNSDKQPQQQKQKQKKEFKSKELTKNDVRRILEELKNQEQKIRAKEFGGKAKERPLGKDW